MTMLLEIAIKGAVVLAAGSLLALAARRRSAATRHLIWSATVAVVLALPALVAMTPDNVVAVDPDSTLARVLPAMPSGSETSRVPAEPGPAVSPPAPSASAQEESPIARPAGDFAGADLGTATQPALDLGALAMLVWVAGAALVLLVLAGERVRLTFLARRAESCGEGPIFDTCRAVSDEAGLRRAPRVLAGPAQVMPMTWGLARSVVMLPSAIESWPESRRLAVLRHEIAHIRRRDDVVQIMATVVAALHWFNPLAWVALHRLRVEREFACDDEVLQRGGPASDYAAELLAVATRYRATPVVSLVAQTMARPSQLRQRVLAVLEGSRERRALTTRRAIAGLSTALVLALPLASVELAGAPTERDATIEDVLGRDISTPELPTEVAAARPETERYGQAQTACWTSGAQTVSTTNTDDDNWSHRWISEDCVAEMTLRGDLVFNDAFDRITGISSGGRFTLDIDEDGTRRHLVVTRAGNGEAVFTWRVNDRAAPFDAAANAWVASVLPAIFRATGLAAEARTASIFARQGATGVLAEVERMRSNSVRGRYLIALLAQPRLDDAALTGTLRAAAAINSTSTRSRVLASFDDQHGARLLDGGVATAFWQAVDTIDSNSTMRRLLMDIVEGEPAGSPVVARAIDEARERIDSNSTLSGFLRELAAAYPGIATSGPHAERFWQTVATIDSSSNVKSLLLDLTNGEAMDARLLPLVLDTARQRINSDSTQAEFLSAMAARYPEMLSGGAVSDQFWTIVRQVRSSSTLSELLLTLSSQAGVRPAVLDRVLAAGRAGISSSSQLGRFLVSFAERHRAEAGGRLEADMLAAAGSIGSRSTRERTLARLSELGIG